MKISAQNHGFIDLTEDQEILAFIEKIDKTAVDIEINLHGCLIGYETSLLIEGLASKLSSANTKKRIFINIEYPFLSAETLWEWFFKNSSLWAEHDLSNYNGDKISIIHKAMLDKFNIELSIGSK